MLGQASMIDILLLGLFISFVLIGGAVFIGQEELRAQSGKEEAVYAQGMLITALQWRNATLSNMTGSELIEACFCGDERQPFNGTMKAMEQVMNWTNRDGYNYIFYVEAKNATCGGRNETLSIYDRQATICAKHLPSIAHSTHMIFCPSDGKRVVLEYYMGIWPSWKDLPLNCT
ncbi:MAG: hypothetical protein QXU82_00035 [Candidatus Aenigmatarchaeota archaeon]